MHNIYDFTIRFENCDYEISAGVEEDTDGSGRPLISVEIEHSDDAQWLIDNLGSEALIERIIEIYNSMKYQ